MTAPKKDSNKRRVIIDLSSPKGASVNDGVAKNFFQGRPFTYTLPSASDLAAHLIRNPVPSYLWKADLERAYRQLRSDPLDYPLMGISHKGSIYLDVCPSFGCRGSSAAQQRVSRAVCFLMQQQGHTVLAYVDDFCGVAPTLQEAVSAFSAFEGLCSKLGLKLAPEKSSFPSTLMEWLGFIFDSQNMTITIPQSKLAEIVDLARTWTYRKRATRHDLQVLAGKLMYVSHCVIPARKFMSRVLAALRSAPSTGYVGVDCELRRDVTWFVDYATSCNGKVLLQQALPSFRIECDACLEGGGGFSDSHYYSVIFSQGEKEGRHISQLEAINIVVALKTLLPPDLSSHHVVVVTDNIASAHVLNSGRTRDYVMAACARELWLIAALRNLIISVEHAPGETLVLADALSRRSMSPHHEATAQRLTRAKNLSPLRPISPRYVLTTLL